MGVVPKPLAPSLGEFLLEVGIVAFGLGLRRVHVDILHNGVYGSRVRVSGFGFGASKSSGLGCVSYQKVSKRRVEVPFRATPNSPWGSDWSSRTSGSHGNIPARRPLRRTAIALKPAATVTPWQLSSVSDLDQGLGGLEGLRFQLGVDLCLSYRVIEVSRKAFPCGLKYVRVPTGDLELRSAHVRDLSVVQALLLPVILGGSGKGNTPWFV